MPNRSCAKCKAYLTSGCFQFPSEKERKTEWIRALDLVESELIPSHGVCLQHFPRQAFFPRKPGGPLRLKNGKCMWSHFDHGLGILGKCWLADFRSIRKIIDYLDTDRLSLGVCMFMCLQVCLWIFSMITMKWKENDPRKLVRLKMPYGTTSNVSDWMPRLPIT